MSNTPYRGFETIDYEGGTAITEDPRATTARVLAARQFMIEQAPRMAVAAGLIPNLHRRVDCETAEEGFGTLAHRILVSRRLRASFVVLPGVLSGAHAKDFLTVVGPEGDHLVVAAGGYENQARESLAAQWTGSLTLLTFTGTEREPGYEIHNGS